MRKKTAISVDGVVFYGYKQVATVVASNDHYLFVKAHRHNGEFVHNGRKIKVLNFFKNANWERYAKMKKDMAKAKKKYEQLQSTKEKKRISRRKYRLRHLEECRRYDREYYHRRKAQKMIENV